MTQLHVPLGNKCLVKSVLVETTGGCSPVLLCTSIASSPSLAGQTFMAHTGGKRTSGHFRQVFVDLMVTRSVLFEREREWICELQLLEGRKRTAQTTDNRFSLITDVTEWLYRRWNCDPSL